MNQESVPEQNNALEKFLGIPCPQEEMTVENQSKYTKFTNALQMVLWIRHHGKPPRVDQVDEWQGVFSINFRKSFEEVLKGNVEENIPPEPRFFAEHATIGDIPEEKWERLESSIYA